MSLRTPPLRSLHAERGAEFTEFGGWEMPVDFDSIRAEHEAVRSSAGVFDVSHMGQIEVRGPEAGELTDRLVTNDVSRLGVGDALYAAITDEDGVMIDDTVVYRRDEAGYLFVPNAGNDGRAHDRWVDYRDRWGLDAEVENRTDDYAMFAVQGPDAVDLVERLGAVGVGDLSRFEADRFELAGVDCWIARTGYTGEDGVELVLPAAEARRVWTTVVDGPDGSGGTDDGAGTGDEDDRTGGCRPCGLGARDTLRLEAGLLLSGQDFHPERNPRTPYEADVSFVVDLDREFVGREALARVAEDGPDERLVGLRMDERGVPRHGYPIESPSGESIGEVTSGTMSPTLGEPIGMGYVPVEYADPGTELRVVVRDRPRRARVVSKRFLEGDG